MYTLLIKWGCTPSKESNIVLVWCDSSPYHTLDFFWSQDLRETCADAAGRISRLRPDFAFFFQSCAPLKTPEAGFETDSCFFMFFSSLSGMKISCDVPEMGWSQKMVEGWFSSTHDLCQLKPISRCIHSRQIRWHLEVPAFGAFCNEIKWLRSPYCPKMMMIIQYLYWCFCFLVSQHIRGNARHFFKNWLA